MYRYEYKYFIDARTAEILRRRVSAVFRTDSHSNGVYQVNNLYFDDIHNTFFNQKEEGAYKRDKYRIRFYNGDKSFIRLENKRKTGDKGYKRSVKLTEGQYDILRRGDIHLVTGISGPVWDDFVNINRVSPLRPALEFTYRREAYVCDAGDVRITFDSRIAESEFSGALPGVLEVKHSRFFPDFITHLLSGCNIVQTEMSKYCMVMDCKRRAKLYV